VEYWHYRSENYLTFFFVGFKGDASESEFKTVIDHSEETFSARTFSATIKEIEKQSAWKYGGRTSIVICRGRMRKNVRTGQHRAMPDLSSVVTFELEAAQSDGVIDSPQSFFEDLIRYASNNKATEEQLSDKLGFRAFASAFVDGILENIPIKGVRRGVKAAAYLRVQDLEVSTGEESA
jgi:hypothetical protein